MDRRSLGMSMMSKLGIKGARESQRMRRCWLCALVAIGILVGVAAPSAEVQAVAANPSEGADQTAEGLIRALLARQVSSWNAGDIDGFMRGYWESPELTFSSGGEVTRGYEATRQRYHRRYATREQMGRLQFRELEVRLVGDQAAYVLGDWELEREGGERFGGKFTLVMGVVDGNWKILHDHTSSRESGE